MQNTSKKILFIKTCATADNGFVNGREFELPTAEADSHIRSGLAVEIPADRKPAAARPRGN